MPKEFKTTDEQIEILKSRGLFIPDETKAKNFLLNNNYYRVSGYSLTLRKHDVFYPSAAFENIMDIYYFDEKFRSVLMYALECAETKIKSLYAYYFAEKYGGLGYLDKSCFSDEVSYNSIIAKVNGQRDRSRDSEAFIKHYVDDLHEDMPIWVFIELFTLTDLSRLYSISDKDIQLKIASHFGMKHNNCERKICTFLKCFSTLRNICAHNGRVFNRLFRTKPQLSQKETAVLRRNKQGMPDNSRVFGYIIALKRILEQATFNEIKDEILDLQQKYPFVDMKYYGFSDEWYNKI